MLLILLCACLLLFAVDCTRAAAEAFTLWWNSVLPALFPFYLCTSLLLRQEVLPALSRILRRPAKRLRLPEQVFPCCLLGAVAGYPNGARLCAALRIEAFMPYCNLCSPMFLAAVIGAGMLGSAACALPLCIAHYGGALLLLLFAPRALPNHASACPEMDAGAGSGGIIRIVGDGMGAMLQIGGCICIFFVVAELLRRLSIFTVLDGLLQRAGLPPGLAAALLQGILEFTGGCAAVCALSLPLRVAVACCAFLASFGGICVYLQTRLFLSGGGISYFATKLLHGLLAALIAYLCTPIFLPLDAAVMSQAAEDYLNNALSGGSLLFASAISMLGTYLAALVLSALVNRSGQTNV